MNTKTDDFMKYRKYIGYIIKTKRKKNHITQTQLADELNINVSTVSRYERADVEIPASYLEKISKVCKFEPREYFTCTKSPEKLLYEIACILGYRVSNIDYIAKESDINIELIDELEHTKWLAEKVEQNPNYALKYDISTLVGDIIVEYTPKRDTEYLLEYWKKLQKRGQLQ